MGEAPDTAPARRALALLTVAAVALSFFFALGRYPLFDVDEGAFSQATLEMFQRGDFLSTTLNGAPRYDKPILVYWLQAASVKAMGVSEWAFRLPSALCAALWSLLVFGFARRYYGVRIALLATLAMATSLAVCIVARMATADALLNMLIAASMFAAWIHLESGERRWLYASFAAAGLGFLAKGPVAVLIPFAVTLLFCLLRRDFRTWLRAAFDPLGLAIFALLALPWYVLTVYQEGWVFADGFFMRHNLSRLTQPLQGHDGSAAYYLPVLVLATLPFTAWLLRALTRLRAVCRDELQLFLLLWFGFVFVFFSLAATKLPHYLVYGLTGLFIVMAAQAGALRSHFWTLLPAVLLFAGLAALPGALEWAHARVGDAYYREVIAEAADRFDGGYFGFALSALAFAVWLMFEPFMELPTKVVSAALASVVAMSAYVLPAAAGSLQDPVKEAALLAKARGYSVVMWGLNTPSFSVYSGKPTPSREPRPGDVVLTKDKRLAELGMRFERVYSRRGIVLVRVLP